MLQQANDGGSTVGIGRGSAFDFRLSLERLTAPIEHFAGDLVATVAAGARLADVNAILRQNNQWLPLDPPDAEQSTIGSLVATNSSGPRRHRYGTPRDLIIGIEVALADGRVAKSGGRVVKNVAGYDLARLMCGSFGSLAVITSATFKLSPVSPASRTVIVKAAGVDALAQLAQTIAAAPLTPSCLELHAPDYELFVRFETTPLAADRQAAAVCAICTTERGAAGTPVVLSDRDEAAAWSQFVDAIWQAPGTRLKIVVLPVDVARLLLALETTCRSESVKYAAGGRAALGVCHVRLSGDANHHVRIIETLRREVGPRGGSVVVEQTGADFNEGRWGDLGDSLPLMRAVKARFDPRGTLNPGGGPGGL